MKKLLFIIVFNLSYFIIKGQDYIGLSKRDIEYNIDYYLRNEPEAFEGARYDTMSISLLGVELYWQIDYNFKILTLENGTDTICTNIYMNYLCDSCGEAIIQQNIENKHRKWILKSPNQYISSKKIKHINSPIDNKGNIITTEMNITLLDDRYLIQISMITLPKKDWKSIIKNEKNTNKKA